MLGLNIEGNYEPTSQSLGDIAVNHLKPSYKKEASKKNVLPRIQMLIFLLSKPFKVHSFTWLLILDKNTILLHTNNHEGINLKCWKIS